MVRSSSTAWTVALALALVTTGCPADEQAVDPPGGPPVDMSPDPRIQQAPAYPTPPGEVPIGLQPDTTPRDEVDLDTIPAAGAQPGATPVRPGAPAGAPPQPPQQQPPPRP